MSIAIVWVEPILLTRYVGPIIFTTGCAISNGGLVRFTSVNGQFLHALLQMPWRYQQDSNEPLKIPDDDITYIDRQNYYNKVPK